MNIANREGIEIYDYVIENAHVRKFGYLGGRHLLHGEGSVSDPETDVAAVLEAGEAEFIDEMKELWGWD